MNPGIHALPETLIEISRHAAARMQQRGVDMLDVFLMMAYGRVSYDGDATVRQIDRKRSEQIARDLMQRAKDPARLRDLYLVESGNKLITVAHSTGRVRR